MTEEEKAAADDFVVLWDNAYAIHHLEFPGVELASVREASLRHGTEDQIVQFASTSKVTFAGAGVAFVSASQRVLAFLEACMSVFMIGPDKVNQLRHARFLTGRVEDHMRAHAELLRPKFARRIGPKGVSTTTDCRARSSACRARARARL